MDKYYLGIDVGSVSTNIVLIDKDNRLVYKKYVRTQGRPIEILKAGIKDLSKEFGHKIIKGVGVTGSGRKLAGRLVGADIVKNEITAHAIASLDYNLDRRTVIEIGGQDSKIIILKDKIVIDFAMNTVCAAGTGSFLDRQAGRLGIDINEFGDLAVKSSNPVRIAGRCAVFAESDMIHKQQLGHKEEDIVKGLCMALTRNYISNIAKGKNIEGPILFQGGVAANKGIKIAFEEELGMEVLIPPNYDVMGAIGAAILGKEEAIFKNKTDFKGFAICQKDFHVSSIECSDCPNLCEILQIKEDNRLLDSYGDKCGKWSH